MRLFKIIPKKSPAIIRALQFLYEIMVTKVNFFVLNLKLTDKDSLINSETNPFKYDVPTESFLKHKKHYICSSKMFHIIENEKSYELQKSINVGDFKLLNGS